MTGIPQDRPAQLAIGPGLIAISVVLAVGALRFPPERGFVILGAHVYPYGVAVFLGVVGLLLSYQAMQRWLSRIGGHDDESESAVRRQTRCGLGDRGLVAVALLINIIGFVLAAGLLFACSARGFGSRHPLRDLAIGIALTLPIYWLFKPG